MKYKCEKCNKEFFFKKSLNSHNKSTHSEEIKEKPEEVKIEQPKDEIKDEELEVPRPEDFGFVPEKSEIKEETIILDEEDFVKEEHNDLIIKELESMHNNKIIEEKSEEKIEENNTGVDNMKLNIFKKEKEDEIKKIEEMKKELDNKQPIQEVNINFLTAEAETIREIHSILVEYVRRGIVEIKQFDWGVAKQKSTKENLNKLPTTTPGDLY